MSTVSEVCDGCGWPVGLCVCAAGPQRVTAGTSRDALKARVAGLEAQLAAVVLMCVEDSVHDIIDPDDADDWKAFLSWLASTRDLHTKLSEVEKERDEARSESVPNWRWNTLIAALHTALGVPSEGLDTEELVDIARSKDATTKTLKKALVKIKAMHNTMATHVPEVIDIIDKAFDKAKRESFSKPGGE